MVGMTVAAVLIICDNDVRAVLTYNRDELIYYFLHPGLGKGVGFGIGLAAVHARVMIAEEVEMPHLEDCRGVPQLGVPDLCEASTVGRIFEWLQTQAWILDISQITVGTGHEHGRVAALCRQA
jgi:hypothetical protein